jgi:succinyldiaminopimelate transaminase
VKLPDFPWDTLAPFGAKAKEHPGGIIDLSVGTPVDPTPEFIQNELVRASNAPGYPLTIGSPQLRDAMRAWAEKVLGVAGEFDVLPTIGSKELVAWLPTFLESRTVQYPDVAYPTYLVGAIIAGAKPHAVGINPATWQQSDLTWINTPSNPTGRVHSVEELRDVIEFSRTHNSIVASDECYLNFAAEGKAQPVSLLRVAAGNNKNLLSVYSLSKRSNLAGYRAGLVVGDPELIARIREIRKHAGMLVPAPVQRAMAVALGDELHVQEQAARYAKRREVLRPSLEKAGFIVEHSDAGLYIWCTRNEQDWDSITWLAGRGILATPGHFYGEAGKKHIRVALTTTDELISEAAMRIRA